MNSLLARPQSYNFLYFLLNWLYSNLHRTSSWTGSQQQSNNIQCKSKSRAFSQEESRWKVRLDFPTALTAPRLKAQGETLPTYRDTLSVGVWGGDGNGAGRSRAPYSCQLCGRLWRERKGSFLSLWPLLPSRPPLHAYGPTSCKPFSFSGWS